MDMPLKCDKCGEMINANPRDAGRLGQCPSCGSPMLVGVGLDNQPHSPPPPPFPLPPPAQTVSQTDEFAIASLVLGILSIVPGVYIGGLVMGILAIVFSRMAMARIKAQPGSINSQGVATAGLITGIVGLSISVLIILVFGAIAGIGLAFIAAIVKAMANMPK